MKFMNDNFFHIFKLSQFVNSTYCTATYSVHGILNSSSLSWSITFLVNPNATVIRLFIVRHFTLNTSHNTTSSMYMNAMHYDFEQQKVQRFNFIWQDFHSNEFFLSQQEKNNNVSQQERKPFLLLEPKHDSYVILIKRIITKKNRV